MVPAGTYNGVPLGRAEAGAAWTGPMAKWTERLRDTVAHGMPAVAAAAHYRVRTLPVLFYIGGMFAAPRNLARLERDALCRLLRLPGRAMPIRDQHDLCVSVGRPGVPRRRDRVRSRARDPHRGHDSAVDPPLLAHWARNGGNATFRYALDDWDTLAPGVPIAIARRDALSPRGRSRRQWRRRCGTTRRRVGSR